MHQGWENEELRGSEEKRKAGRITGINGIVKGRGTSGEVERTLTRGTPRVMFMPAMPEW